MWSISIVIKFLNVSMSILGTLHTSNFGIDDIRTEFSLKLLNEVKYQMHCDSEDVCLPYYLIW